MLASGCAAPSARGWTRRYWHKRRRRRAQTCLAIKEKVFWIETESQEAMTTAVEGGIDHFLFPEGRTALAEAWQKIAKIHPVYLKDGKVHDDLGNQVRTNPRIANVAREPFLQAESIARKGKQVTFMRTVSLLLAPFTALAEHHVVP